MDDNMLYGIALKKCPWCGSPGKLFTKSFHPLIVDHAGRECFSYFVRCVNPDCEATAPRSFSNDIFRSKEEAVMIACKGWNTRGG